MLDQTLADVISEIAELVALKQRLEERLRRVGQKMNLNADRLGVRSTRPPREKTMDEVERSLLNQQGMLGSFSERVKRAIDQIHREIATLEGVRAKLEADLRDKVCMLMCFFSTPLCTP